MNELQELRKIREELLKMRSRLDELIDMQGIGEPIIAQLVWESVDKACLDLEVLEAIK
tara:strand:- start:1764 stop:1937 length:174 start_codon:yes stop_codon:yes gene_type:complete